MWTWRGHPGSSPGKVSSAAVQGPLLHVFPSLPLSCLSITVEAKTCNHLTLTFKPGALHRRSYTCGCDITLCTHAACLLLALFLLTANGKDSPSLSPSDHELVLLHSQTFNWVNICCWSCRVEQWVGAWHLTDPHVTLRQAQMGTVVCLVFQSSHSHSVCLSTA